MRKLGVVMALVGCTAPTAGFRTPASGQYLATATHPLCVEYDVLDLVQGQACATQEVLDSVGNTGASDKPAIGHAYLYERAKHEALEQVKADGLVMARTQYSTAADGQRCIYVTGRAVRVRTMRAANECGPASSPAPAPVVRRSKVPSVTGATGDDIERPSF